MAENRTRPTDASVDGFVSAIADETRRRDCEALVEFMSRLTGQAPRMWGSSIVGFGSYHYQYDSGREGEMCLTGFAPRKTDISIYLVASGDRQDSLLARLGRHKMGKACLNVRRLSDIDSAVLQELIADSAAAVRHVMANTAWPEFNGPGTRALSQPPTGRGLKESGSTAAPGLAAKVAIDDQVSARGALAVSSPMALEHSAGRPELGRRQQLDQ